MPKLLLFIFRLLRIVQQFLIAHMQHTCNCLQLYICYKTLTIFNSLDSILINIQPFNLQHIRKLPLRNPARHLLPLHLDSFAADVIAPVFCPVFIHNASRDDIYCLSFPSSYDKLGLHLTFTECQSKFLWQR